MVRYCSGSPKKGYLGPQYPNFGEWTFLWRVCIWVETWRMRSKWAKWRERAFQQAQENDSMWEFLARVRDFRETWARMFTEPLKSDSKYLDTTCMPLSRRKDECITAALNTACVAMKMSKQEIHYHCEDSPKQRVQKNNHASLQLFKTIHVAKRGIDRKG